MAEHLDEQDAAFRQRRLEEAGQQPHRATQPRDPPPHRRRGDLPGVGTEYAGKGPRPGIDPGQAFR